MKVLIADDEMLARERLKRLLGNFPGWTVIGEAHDGDSAWTMCQELQPDLLILDIRMPGLDGLQLARKVAELNPPPSVLFSTAYAEHALTAFQTIATAYLLKPVTLNKLRTALDKVRAQTRTQIKAELPVEERLEVQRGTQKVSIPLSRVIYIRSDHKMSEVHHLEGVDLLNDSLNTLESLFPSFVRIHRNTLVNPDHVIGLQSSGGSHWVQIKNHSEKLPVSRRQYGEARNRLQKTP